MSKLTIDINGICNLDCDFCYQELDGSELSVEEVISHIKGTQLGVVEIGGGEPLMHNGLFKILQEIAGAGRKAHVSTNGTVIPDGMFDLEENVRDATTIQVSLHAGNRKLYREISGKDLFNRVVDNIGLFNHYYQTMISASIYQNNVDNVPQVVQLAENLGVHLRVNLVMPVGKGKYVNRIDHRQLQELRTYLFSKKLMGGDISSPLLHFNNCIAMSNAYGIAKRGECPLDCGKRYVSPRGEASACEFVKGE